MTHLKCWSFVLFVFLLQINDSTASEQRIGDFEISIDAPWRMEPRTRVPKACKDNCNEELPFDYGAIPINIAILDAFLPDNDVENSVLIHKVLQGSERGDFSIGNVLYKILKEYAKVTVNPGKLILQPNELGFLSDYQKMNLLRFSTLTVFEKIQGQFVRRKSFSINDLHEIELTKGFWQWGEENQAPPPRPQRVLCRRWNGENCLLATDLTDTSEWHAIAMYEPSTKTPGGEITLKLQLTLDARVDGSEEEVSFTQYVNVHLGEARLPKFTQNSYYGDIHYHSQGTDNDGESGYSYRSALQAMSAMGLDFALASDHASNSRQIVSASFRPIGPVESNLLRDLSPDRFAHNIDLVNGTNGANRQVASYPRLGVNLFQSAANSASSINNAQLNVPQLFLGAEVDVIPEVNVGSFAHYDWLNSCYALSPFIIALQNGLVNTAVDTFEDFINPSADIDKGVCSGDNLLDPTSDGRLLIRDIQGPHKGNYVSKEFYGRQHILHFPIDPLREDAFIASNTSKYGGATRRLNEILEEEFIQPNGILFLAHPLSTASGSGFDRLGPDIAPYTEASLRDAFASEHVLGLQLWNEDNHFKTEVGSGDAVSLRPNSKLNQKGEFIPVASLENWQHQRTAKQNINAISMWDSMLMWGLNPEYTHQLEWLPEGEPRRVFMAGGSDAHGDFNYRREGYFIGMQQVGDGAIGKPRNLLVAGAPQGDVITVGEVSGIPLKQSQVVDAFRQGNFIVTDGPIIRLAYDVNKNGIIDPKDKHIGAVVDVSECGFPLLIEWKSTAEFGSVRSIELKMGSFSTELQDGWVYQPWRGNNNVVKPSDAPDNLTFTDENSGRRFTKAHVSTPLGWRGEPRNHVYDPTSGFDMVIQIIAGQGFHGIRRVNINPRDFSIGNLKTTNICNSTSKAITKSITGKTDKTKQNIASITTNPGGGPQVPFGEIGVFEPPQPLPDIDPACLVRTVNNLTIPDKMYVRAKLTGDINGESPYKAYANPIWFNIKNDKFSQCSVATDDMVLERPKSCNRNQINLCGDKGATCEMLRTTSGKHDAVCRWENEKSRGSCVVRGGIWTTKNSRFAKNHPEAVESGKSASCVTQVKNLSCSAKDKKVCQDFSASCDVIRSRKGKSHSVCRWRDDKSAQACKKTPGIWTSLSSKYGKNNPNAIVPGDLGACITDVNNIKDRIQ